MERTDVELVKEDLMIYLRSFKIDTVRAEYSGSGDSGNMDGVYFYIGNEPLMQADFHVNALSLSYYYSRETGTWMFEAKRENKTLEEAVLSFFYAILESKYGGWENNDGASGEFTWDVKTGVITFEHVEYHTESTSITTTL